jgi:hypothetical protein
MEAGRRHRGEIELEWRIRLLNNGHNGRDIGNRRWSCVDLIHIVTGMVWTPAGVPKIPVVTAVAMMPSTMPAIGIPIRWIWSG